jgi:serine/threonine-protein phosphatase 6 regulatory subunit 3
MFWKINFRPASAIDGLLDKPDCTLNEILDEDDVLQEIKSQNKKLVEFLMKPENMEELVKYVCIVADPEMDDKYKFKYPHLACEILTADVFSIVETLCNDEKYLPMLWQFLYEESRLNPLIGSFNSKVLSMLLGQRTLLYIDYVTKVEGFVDMFMKHLGTSAMMDLLLQMIAAPDNDQHRLELANWLTEEGIVYKLIDFIRPSANVDHCVNASQALCDLLRISREAMQISGPSPLLKMLESKEAIDKLLFNMFEEDDPPDWVIINGVAVLLTALERKLVITSYCCCLYCCECH